jgi:hypothetical protein
MNSISVLRSYGIYAAADNPSLAVSILRCEFVILWRIWYKRGIKYVRWRTHPGLFQD